MHKKKSTWHLLLNLMQLCLQTKLRITFPVWLCHVPSNYEICAATYVHHTYAKGFVCYRQLITVGRT